MTTLLLHAPELGNTQIREGLLEMMLVVARTEDYIHQLVASEAIIAAASKKKDVTMRVNPQKDFNLQRWAAEGLSFLTMDVEQRSRRNL